MRIKGWEQNVHITEFLLQKKCGCHSRCHFKAVIPEQSILAYMEQVGKILCLELETGRPVFFGRIQKIDMERTYHSSSLEVSALSLSADIDQDIHCRIFQNPAKRYGDILSASRLQLAHCRIQVDEQVAQQGYTPILLQNQETDFQFIGRVCAYAGMPLWVKDTLNTDIEIKIAASLSERVIPLPEEDILACRVSKTGTGKALQLRLKQYRELGSMVRIGALKEHYIITEVRIERIHGIDEFRYVLLPVKDRQSPASGFPEAKTVKLKARVTNAQSPKRNSAIQVTFIDDFITDMDADKPMWLPYRSPYSGTAGGIVFLPDPGDVVEVLFTNGECLASSTLRSQPLPEECKRTAVKYIGNNTEQRILWRDASLELRSFQNKVVLNKDKIELSVGKSRIIMEENQIILEGDTVILKAANGQIVLSQVLQIQGQGAVNIKGKGEVALNGSKINLC